MGKGKGRSEKRERAIALARERAKRDRRPEAKPREEFKLERRLYFAYGANLSHASMARRCPLAEPVRAMKLQGWELVFRGVADVRPRDGAVLHGALWSITKHCERSLDAFEGYPRGYRKEYFAVRARKGGLEVIEPVMYYAMNASHVAPPSEYYFRLLREGYADWSLDESLLKRAALDALANYEKEED